MNLTDWNIEETDDDEIMKTEELNEFSDNSDTAAEVCKEIDDSEDSDESRLKKWSEMRNE